MCPYALKRQSDQKRRSLMVWCLHLIFHYFFQCLPSNSNSVLNPNRSGFRDLIIVLLWVQDMNQTHAQEQLFYKIFCPMKWVRTWPTLFNRKSTQTLSYLFCSFFFLLNIWFKCFFYCSSAASLSAEQRGSSFYQTICAETTRPGVFFYQQRVVFPQTHADILAKHYQLGTQRLISRAWFRLWALPNPVVREMKRRCRHPDECKYADSLSFQGFPGFVPLSQILDAFRWLL